jgi:hypothetical protein
MGVPLGTWPDVSRLMLADATRPTLYGIVREDAEAMAKTVYSVCDVKRSDWEFAGISKETFFLCSNEHAEYHR